MTIPEIFSSRYNGNILGWVHVLDPVCTNGMPVSELPLSSEPQSPHLLNGVVISTFEFLRAFS